MKTFLRTGLTFGLTSGTITTLGLMVGLHSESGSRAVVIGGILTIAIADAFSDALGIHLSEEAEHTHTDGQVWSATFTTFAAKFVFAATFLLPVLILPLSLAMIASLAWGMLLLTLLSYFIARDQGKPPWRVIGEHLAIAALVVALSHLAGQWISRLVG